jgi:flagellar protein FlaE
MSINPRDYDLDELRKMARERGGQAGESQSQPQSQSSSQGQSQGRQPGQGLDLGSVGGPASDSAADSSLRQGLYRELLPLAADDADKPYLHALPEEYAGEHLVFEWLEFLLMHAGYKGATEAIDYYESVGWITEEAESTLQDYLLGLEDAPAGDRTELDVDDHLLSLVYIAKLSAMC